MISALMMLALGLQASEPPAEPPLVALVERLRLSVPDARAVADLQMCAPHRINKERTRGTLMIAMSRPQQPRTYYAVNFRDGRYTNVIHAGKPDNGEIGGLETVFARSMDKRMQSCRFVPKAELEAAWTALDGEHQ